MHFAYPLGLLALAALPVLVVLYRLRPVRRRVVVPSTSLWSEALRERRQGFGLQKLLRNLSLIALLLTALALALALADPGFVTHTGVRGDTVLIVDVSASMQATEEGESRLEAAKREAARRIDGLAGDARLLLIASGLRPRLLSSFENDRQVLHDALAGVVPTDEAGRPRAALTLARSLLHDRERGRIVFITDAAFDAAPELAARGVELYRVGSAARNVAITRFDLRREPGAEERFQLLLVVRNYTPEPLEVPVRIRLDGRALHEARVALPSEGERTLVLPFAGRASGRASAHIDHEDDLAADNRAFAVLGVDEALRIALYGDGNFYLESALNALPNVLLTRRPALGPELARDARMHDIVVLDRVAPSVLPPGAYLLIDTLAAGLPFAESGPPVLRPALSGQADHTLTRGLDFSALRVDSARRIAPAADSGSRQPLLWSAETSLALAFAGQRRRGVYLGFDVIRSSFPLQAAFPLFIQRSAAWLRGAGQHFSPTQTKAGEPRTIRLPLSQRELILRTPDGEGLVYDVEGGERTLEGNSVAGIYRYTRQDPFGDARHYFAVTLADEEESNIAPRALPAAGGPDAATASATGRRVSALWPWLAMAALLLLGAEWWLGGHAAPLRGRARSPAH